MENEELETIDSSNDNQENLDSSNEEQGAEEEGSEEKEEYSEREKQLYARLKKAEAELKLSKKEEVTEKKVKPVKKEANSNLSTSDILALAKANIDEEDIDEVLEYANYKGISVKEALASSIVQTTISSKAEERKSAQAVNTGATRRGSNAISDDRLLADARKGIMPDKEEDMARLSILRLKSR